MGKKEVTFNFLEVMDIELKKSGMSETQLVEKAGLSKGLLTRIRNGCREETGMSVGTLMSLAAALNIHPMAFFNGSPKPCEDDALTIARRLVRKLGGT